MVRSLALLAVCGLVVTAGCLGGLPGSSPAPTATAATLSATAAGDRAIAAEQNRIDRQATEHANLVDLSFGILDPAEHEVVRRNETGVVVRVDVGYSVSVDCDGDGEPDSALDGANTIATYLVSEERVRLLDVSQDFFDPGRHC